MSRRRSVLVPWLLLACLLLPQAVLAADTDLVAMLRIVPRSPGGSAEMPLPLALYGESGFYFEIGIRDEIGPEKYDEYIGRRLSLLTASYTVQILDHGLASSYTPETVGEHWTSLPSESGVFRVPASLLPDHVYSWQVVANVDGGGGSIFNVQSPSLYFHTSGYDVIVHGEAAVRGTQLRFVNAMALLAQLQSAENVAIRHSLQGRGNYVNYPVASDSYICSAIEQQNSRPLPAPAAGRLLDVPELLALGQIMREAHELHAWIEHGRDPLGQLRSLANSCRLYINSLQNSQTAALPTLASMLEVARRMGVEEALSSPEQLAMLSELLLLGDKLVATGSMRLEHDPVDSFAEYAQSCDRRLRQLSDMDPALYNLLGAQRGRIWQEFFRSQRADLALLREEIRSGLVNSIQLEEQIALSRERARMQLPAAFDGNELQQYKDAMSAFAKLAPAGEPEAVRNLLESQLTWIAAGIWPVID